MNSPAIEHKLEDISNLLTEQVILQREVLNLNQAAEYLSISKSHLYRLTSSHQIAFYKPSKKIFFKRSDLDTWMLQNRHASAEEIENKASDHLFTDK